MSILAALAVPAAGYAVTPAAETPSVSSGAARGKSFLDYAGTSHVEERFHFIPATFPGPLAPARREPATGTMLLASFGLMLYLGTRRQRALVRA